MTHVLELEITAEQEYGTVATARPIHIAASIVCQCKRLRPDQFHITKNGNIYKVDTNEKLGTYTESKDNSLIVYFETSRMQITVLRETYAPPERVYEKIEKKYNLITLYKTNCNHYMRVVAISPRDMPVINKARYTCSITYINSIKPLKMFRQIIGALSLSEREIEGLIDSILDSCKGQQDE